MGRDDWYRNQEWNQEIEDAFLTKLRRSRSGKAQYLRIQACMLRETYPEVAHRLLDMYFELGDDFDRAQAHLDKAHAFLAQAQVDSAIASFEAALSREKEFPNLQTQAYLDFSFLVAVKHMRPFYPRVLIVLDDAVDRPMFPIDIFRWNAANALIKQDAGLQEQARVHAVAALEAAARDSSGFRYHRSLGLVGEEHLLLRRELEHIAYSAAGSDKNERQSIH